MALSVGIDIAFTAASVALGATTGIFGLALIAAKSGLSSFIVSVIEMIVDRNFSKQAFRDLFDSTIIAIIIGPILSKILPKVMVKSFKKFVNKWASALIDSLISNVVGDQAAYFLMGGENRGGDNQDKPKPIGPTYWRPKK